MNEILPLFFQYYSIGLLAIVATLALLFLFKVNKGYYILFFLLAWFPLENLILRYTPLDYYAVVKYSPEVLLYCAFAVVWVRYMLKQNRFWPESPINKWLLLFVAVSAVSFLLNFSDPSVWVFGLRQLLRFAVVFFFILMEKYESKVVKRLFFFALMMILLEAVLGIVQYLFGGYLDKFLFFGESVNVGLAHIGAIEQFWAPGSRVFATMGRYDRLGSLLALGIAMLFPWMYIAKTVNEKVKFWIVFFVLSTALILTYSRASFLAALASICVGGIWLMRDQMVKKVLAGLAVFMILYLGAFALIQGNVSNIVDKPVQPLSERLWEAVSLRSWKESFDGYGRIFFIINTPLVVVPSAPLFGVGLGNYGGGVAAALLNTKTYDRLHLPFGIQNIYGQIDNNWLSIWGETGTFGLICWTMIFVALFMTARDKSGERGDIEKRTMARALICAVPAVVLLGFFGPYFEFRALMFYFWLLAGLVLTYDY